MGIQRQTGSGWAGAAKAAYTLYAANVVDGGPAIWLRARSIWRATNTAWQSATAGTASAADITSLVATTMARSVNGGAEILNPQTGDPNIYWESYATVTAGSTCNSYAVWVHSGDGMAGTWQFLGSFNIAPSTTQRIPMTYDGPDRGFYRWCVTAWESSTTNGDLMPDGQQGFSRLAAA